MGVKRAVKLVLGTAADASGPVFTWGPLIHNPQVVDFLRRQGVNIAEKIEDFDADATIVIRSHGVPPDIKKFLAQKGVGICDATCPKVARVQGIIKKYSAKGRDVVIIGYADHAEVKGLLGYAGERGHVVCAVRDIPTLPELERPVVIGQTTLNREKYLECADAVKSRFPKTLIIDTLCDSTSQRQIEIREMAKEADAIVVVGGYNSSNTKRLFEVAESTGVASFWVETEEELDPEDFLDARTVAVTAGASTPHWIVSRVIERLERMRKGRIPLWEIPSIKDFGYAVIQSNLLTGLAAAMLAASALFLAGAKIDPLLLLATGLFIFGVNTVYNLIDWQGFILADPSKLGFFWSNRVLLATASVLGLVVSASLMWFFGPLPFGLTIAGVFIAGLFAVLRGTRLFPISRKLVTWREVPGAKDLLYTFGWLFAAGLIPIITTWGSRFWPSILALVWVGLLSLLRSALFSITDLETDRILERESYATVVGEKGVWKITIAAVVLSAAIIVVGVSTGIFRIAVLSELLFLAYMIFLILRFRRSGIGRGTRAELAVEGGFISGGVIAILIGVLC